MEKIVQAVCFVYLAKNAKTAYDAPIFIWQNIRYSTNPPPKKWSKRPAENLLATKLFLKISKSNMRLYSRLHLENMLLSYNVKIA
jgi:hypothetical protein